MIPNSFPRTQGQLSREQYLTLLLLALLNQTGGELRISAKNLESVDSGGKLLVDWDTENQQAVLRIGSPTLVVAEVKGAGWTQVTPSPQPSPQNPADPTKHAIIDDARLAQFLEKFFERDRMRQWREQGNAAVSNMPEPGA